jgi:hypothetical protein
VTRRLRAPAHEQGGARCRVGPAPWLAGGHAVVMRSVQRGALGIRVGQGAGHAGHARTWPASYDSACGQLRKRRRTGARRSPESCHWSSAAASAIRASPSRPSRARSQWDSWGRHCGQPLTCAQAAWGASFAVGSDMNPLEGYRQRTRRGRRRRPSRAPRRYRTAS